ncbi:MAG: hypothetical protein QG622_1303 [Actinomycetota bacterium]|nr:hypothetical protein [Actinomycetota bacterium]
MTTAVTGPVTGPVARPSGAAPCVPEAEHPRWTRAEHLVLAAMGSILFALYTGYALARHAKYETTGFDLGIFDQVIRSYSRFSVPTSPLKGVGYNILGDHFHPILVLLAPLYWLWDDPRVLLIAQAGLFALSIWPVGAFVRRRFGGRIGLIAAFAFGVSWPLQGAVHFDFHEIAIGVLLVAILVNALDLRRDRLIAVSCLLLLLVREDMGSLVILVGLLVALRRPLGPGDRRRSVLFGGGLGLVGVAGFWLATSVVIPALGPSGFTYWTFNALGPDPVSAVRFMLLHPWRVAALMVTPAVKFHTLVAIFAPTALLALGSPYVLLTAPFLLQRMLNDRELLWQTNFHYTSIIAPVLVMAAADTVARLMRRHPGLLAPRVTRAGGRRVVVSLAVVWAAWCVVLPTWSMWTRSALYPVTGGFLSGRVWDRDLRWRSVHETLPMIPADQCVEADNQLAPQLTRTNYVTRVTMSEGLASWAVIDMYQKETGWQTPPPALALDRLEREGFEIVSWRGPIVLLHRDVPIDPVCRMTS